MKCEILHVPGQLRISSQQSTVDVVAATVQPRLANTLIRQLSQVAPLENLRHLKRIRRRSFEGKDQLSVILCFLPEQGNPLEGLPNDVSELINAYQLQPFVTRVSKYAASSKEEWEEQCKLWPTSYHPSSNNVDVVAGFSEEDSETILCFMEAAIELTKSGHPGDQVVNAAVIVDPSLKQVIASGCDQTCLRVNSSNKCNLDGNSCHGRTENQPGANGTVFKNIGSVKEDFSYSRVSCLHPCSWARQRPDADSSPVKSDTNHSWHPLRHAALVAIEYAAARDRCLFPTSGLSKDQYIQNSDMDFASAIFPAKRPKTELSKDVSNTPWEVSVVGDSLAEVLGPCRPYLCTGFDAYLTWEPCTMCAMALVHQRVRRIFYAFPNPSAGALGSIYRLHGEKSLNHHYSVFRVLVPEAVLEKEHN